MTAMKEETENTHPASGRAVASVTPVISVLKCFFCRQFTSSLSDNQAA